MRYVVHGVRSQQSYWLMSPELLNAFSGLLKADIVEAVRVFGGGNSQVYRLVDEHATPWCGKVYAAPSPGRRDRLATEWQALCFLRDNGLRCVPQPIACENEHKIAVFQWIEGDQFSGRVITKRETEQALEFLRELDKVRATPAAGGLPFASEAFFNLDGIYQNLISRGTQLSAVTGHSTEHDLMRTFVNGELSDARERFFDRALQGYKDLGCLPTDLLSEDERILSPSDFGFHNALKSPSGLVWLDFEYFGWDDPAKTMTDFVLHPAMKIDVDARRSFWVGACGSLSRGGNLAARAKLLYPLHGVKWCLIILNEFLHDGEERRLGASGEKVVARTLRLGQFSKARQLLRTVIEHDESFPYQ